MKNCCLEKFINNKAVLSVNITQFDGSHPIHACEKSIHEFDNAQKISFLDSSWEVTFSLEEALNNKDAIDGVITFKLVEGALSQGNMSVNMLFEDWSKDNYVLIPAAAYNGNRFKAVEMPYPPMLTKAEDIGVEIPTTITDVPRLNINGGM
jgi:hypothetical protein